VPNSVLGLAASNLKIALAGLLVGLVGVAALVALPVLLVAITFTAAVNQGLPLAAGTGTVTLSGPPLEPGELACPVSRPVLTQAFGPTDLAGEPALFGFPHFHPGVDLGAQEGAPVLAAEGGQVVEAAEQVDSLGVATGYGNLIEIAAPGGRVEYYGHLSRFAVGRGALVSSGQLLGWVGTTGYSTGPHVHFELRADGTPVDPAPYLGRCWL
jgi:murein DD-endopeptidase MepM/ murein hydrolase activator NlpD